MFCRLFDAPSQEVPNTTVTTAWAGEASDNAEARHTPAASLKHLLMGILSVVAAARVVDLGGCARADACEPSGPRGRDTAGRAPSSESAKSLASRFPG